MFDQKDFDALFAVSVMLCLLSFIAWQLLRLKHEHDQLIYAWCARCGRGIRKYEKFRRIRDEADSKNGCPVCEDCMSSEKEAKLW